MKRILIVDDELRITEEFTEAFGQDYDVFSAREGTRAIQLIHEMRPALIVLDWRLKGKVEGKDVLFFSKHEYPEIIVCIVTASVHLKKEILSYGADAFIEKPAENFLERIKAILPPD